jgi:hypothetical protein
MQIRRSSRRRLVLNYVGTVFSAWPTVKFNSSAGLHGCNVRNLNPEKAEGLTPELQGVLRRF